jgi:hypothetical protein
MEFRRALRDEPVDAGLEREHWRRIVPLLQRRSPFAGAREFLLYDCRDASGNVNEDVFAYSNQQAGSAALVLYHNRYAEARGTIRWSAAYAEKHADGIPAAPAAHAARRTWGCAPGRRRAGALPRPRGRQRVLWRVRDLREHGLRVELRPFGSRVLLDWQEVARDGRPWDDLAHTLPPEGSPDLEHALWALAVRPAHALLEEALLGAHAAPAAAREAILRAFDGLRAEAERLLSWPPHASAVARLRLAERLERLDALQPPADAALHQRAVARAWLLLEGAGAAFVRGAPETPPGTRLFDELRLREPIARAMRLLGAEGERAWRLAAGVRTLLAHPRAASADGTPEEWRALLADPDARYAAELDEDTPRADAPAWLKLPARLDPGLAPRR